MITVRQGLLTLVVSAALLGASATHVRARHHDDAPTPRIRVDLSTDAVAVRVDPEEERSRGAGAVSAAANVALLATYADIPPSAGRTTACSRGDRSGRLLAGARRNPGLRCRVRVPKPPSSS